MTQLLERMIDGLRLGMFSSGAAWDAAWVTSVRTSAGAAAVDCVAELAVPDSISLDLIEAVLRTPAGAVAGLPAASVAYAGQVRHAAEYDSSRGTPAIGSAILSMPIVLDRTQPVSIWIELQEPLSDARRDLLHSALGTFEVVIAEAPFHGQCQQVMSAVGATQLTRVAEGTFLYWAEAIACDDAWVKCLDNLLRHNWPRLGLKQVRIEQ